MTEENAFVRAILADPGDPAVRLVYADWLEEHGGAESAYRAEYLRVECELDGLPTKDRSRRKLRARLLELRKLVGDVWWRQLDWANVEYCVKFEYRCPQRWDTLLPTDDESVRHCTLCDRDVHYCSSTGKAHQLAEAGECVAIDSRRARLPLELLANALQGGRRLLGRVAPRVPNRLPLSERRQQPASE
jgi:uncharacterized protein (TIGR02996 family)